MLEELKQKVLSANLKLVEYNLVTFTWGNVSGIDRDKGLMVIKPSGVKYEELTIDDLVVLDLKGNIIEGKLNPSTDTPTHLYLYNKYPDLGGITHTHSVYATSWAQAGLDIPPLGTTHADNFYGPIPCTPHLEMNEIKTNYEYETGVIIAKTFGTRNLDPQKMPAILCNNHGPFTFGNSPLASVEMAKVLEIVAQMAYQAYGLNQNTNKISQELLDKHYYRKHGETAYYGQPRKES
ncbi:L-ribulose-5-phosphate 4-epimerase [Spiroplasma eriocheiris]|uniref:L-ribulose-5-phosphate 4-epimerase n=1 Tax=Spiroplasma eriocheiris TaxID=315358 RepID=A0A0H3XHW3_9MOLU|nr:L-ribulose-5-phosphate 4-epimerase [Spiroplasma eriocheiris]AHF57953.1 L-ribulose-5-phosphate 4-epimerase [Spiroplasma eriocheiris CCTCC M 207170]AKM54393.1 L-ribulose-5-phosphate 4-epimerase [Spiroplasma eriocheiris]